MLLNSLAACRRFYNNLDAQEKSVRSTFKLDINEEELNLVSSMLVKDCKIYSKLKQCQKLSFV